MSVLQLAEIMMMTMMAPELEEENKMEIEKLGKADMSTNIAEFDPIEAIPKVL